MKFQVTLADLRKHEACVSGYNKVVRMLQGKEFTEAEGEREAHIRYKHTDPVSLADIAKNNGIDDALWALRCVEGVDRDARLFAVWCARQVQHLMEDQRSIDALDVAEKYANGKATDEELSSARDAAWYAARDAAWSAARDAAWGAARDAAWDAAREAAWGAARDAAREAARDAAREAAREAAWSTQLAMFLRMCEGSAPWQQDKPKD